MDSKIGQPIKSSIYNTNAHNLWYLNNLTQIAWCVLTFISDFHASLVNDIKIFLKRIYNLNLSV
jgi:hypothetical protein